MWGGGGEALAAGCGSECKYGAQSFQQQQLRYGTARRFAAGDQSVEWCRAMAAAAGGRGRAGATAPPGTAQAGHA